MMKKLGETFLGFVFTAFVFLTTAWASKCVLSIIEQWGGFPFAVEQIIHFSLWIAITLMVLMLIIWICTMISNALQESHMSNLK